MQPISTPLSMARPVCRRPSWLFPSYRQSRCHHLLRLLTFTNTPSYTWKEIISAQLMLMIFETSFVRGVKWRRYKIFAMWCATKTILACVIIIVWGGCQQGRQLVKAAPHPESGFQMDKLDKQAQLASSLSGGQIWLLGYNTRWLEGLWGQKTQVQCSQNEFTRRAVEGQGGSCYLRFKSKGVNQAYKFLTIEVFLCSTWHVVSVVENSKYEGCLLFWQM